MPGQAKTDRFMLSTATVMIGALADLNSLNPAAHSIGLVKNFQLSFDPAYTELTQGITNTVVMSVRTSEAIRASMEVYEYTARNIAYASGLDGTGAQWAAAPTTYLSTASAAAGATTIVVSGDATTGGSPIAAGDFIYLQAGTDDVVHIAKVTSAVYGAPNTTITFTGFAVPTGVTFPVGTRVSEVQRIDLGTGVLFQPTLAAKVVGILPVDNAPFTILFPKVKITRGMNLAFDSGNFTNMPFEFTPYSPVSTDPSYGTYGAASAILFPR